MRHKENLTFQTDDLSYKESHTKESVVMLFKCKYRGIDALRIVELFILLISTQTVDFLISYSWELCKMQQWKMEKGKIIPGTAQLFERK